MRGDHAVLVKDGQAGQAVTAADLEVVRVMGGGHLDRAGAERGVDVVVGDDRDAPAGQRQLHGPADQVGVALVVGVHRDGGVAEHRLGPGGGDDDRVVFPFRPPGGVWGGRAPRDSTVADGDELAFVVAVLDLDVAQCGQAARAPVDDPFGPVDQVVVEEPLEDRLHGPGQALVHREPLAGPVHAIAEPAHLTEDLAAGLRLPLPDPLDEGLAAQVVAAEAFLGEFTLHHVLGSDAGVVHAGQPQGVEALHAAPPDLRVDQRMVQGMADVQGAGNVRRGDDDAERGSAGFRVRGEVTCLLPAFVARSLHLGGGVLGRQLDRLGCAHDR